MSANDLLEGDVVYLSDEGWTRDPAKAAIAHDAETAATMEARGAAAFKGNQVVDAYLVPVALDAHGMPLARHFREAMRQKGPSIHPHYGKQAEFGNVYEA